MDELQKLLAFVAVALNLPKEEVLEKLKDSEDESPILDIYKNKVKTKKDNDFNDGYKKAQDKVLTKLEEDLKAEFGVSSDKKNVELVREILDKKVESLSPDLDEEAVKKHPLFKSREVTEEMVKKHPAYLKKEEEAKTARQEEANKWQKEFDDFKAAQAKNELLKSVKSAAIPEFQKLKPILPQDEKRAERQINELLLKRLEDFNYEKVGESYLVLDKEGKKLEDEVGNTLGFDQLVQKIAQDGFEFKAAEGRDSPGETSRVPQVTGKKYLGKLPTTATEYATIMNDQSIPVEQRLEVQEHWKKNTANV